MIPWSLIWGVGKYVGILAGIAALYFIIDGNGYDRGEAAAEKRAREQIQRMEERLAKRMRENEGLTTDEIDCQLKKLRNPKAPC